MQTGVTIAVVIESFALTVLRSLSVITLEVVCALCNDVVIDKSRIPDRCSRLLMHLSYMQ